MASLGSKIAPEFGMMLNSLEILFGHLNECPMYLSPNWQVQSPFPRFRAQRFDTPLCLLARDALAFAANNTVNAQAINHDAEGVS